MGVELSVLDDDLSLDDLAERDIGVRNIAATFDITGEFDLAALSQDLPNSEFDPGKHRSLVYRPPQPKDTVVLLPPRGRVSIAGVTTKADIVECAEQFSDALSRLGMEREVRDIEVENVVATASLNQTLNLSEISILLGLERTEYEPEQFPGLIYRPDNAVILLFSSGNIVITKTQTFQQVEDAYTHLKEKIRSIPL